MEEIVKMLTVHIVNSNDLYSAYMPFVKGGGLFIKGTEGFVMNDSVLLNLTLLDDPKVHSVECQVIWITPAHAQGGLKEGIGLQFVGNHRQEIHGQIETILAGMLNADRLTDTM
jgi:type IV pilus assembly protein PilZ